MPTWLRLFRKAIPAVSTALLALPFVGPTAARAQAAACERYRTELASLNRNGAAPANAQRQRGEIERLVGYYRAIGCDRGGLFFHASDACGPIAGQIRALQASYQTLLGQAADPDMIEDPRRQLRAAVARACDAVASPGPIQAARPKGSGRLVCVRSCDGSYFPLDTAPKAKGDVAALCSALCPNAEATVFRLPREGGIEQAVSETGEPYMKLPNALRYRTAHDPGCSCKKPDESWARALRKAEGLLERRKGDVLDRSHLAADGQCGVQATEGQAGQDRGRDRRSIDLSTNRRLGPVCHGQHRTQPCVTLGAGQSDPGDRARHHPGARALGRLGSPSPCRGDHERCIATAVIGRG